MYPTDGLDGPSGFRGPSPVKIGPTALPPHVAGLFSAAEAGINQAVADAHAQVEELIASIEPDLLEAESQVHLNIATLVGTVDNELSAQEDVSGAVVQKLYETVVNDVLLAETMLEQAGVHIPISTDQIAVDLQDDTGNAVLARLMGFPPVTDEPIAPNALPILPQPEPIPPVLPPTFNAGPSHVISQEETVAPNSVATPGIIPAETPALNLSPVVAIAPPSPAPAPEPRTVPNGTTVIVEPVPAPVVNVTVNVPPNTSPPRAPLTATPPPNVPVVTPRAEETTGFGGGGGGGGFEPGLEAPPPPPIPPAPTTEPRLITLTYDGLRWDAPMVCQSADEARKQYDAGENNFGTPEQQTNSNVLSSIIRGATASLKTLVDTVGFGLKEEDSGVVYNTYLKLTGDFLGGYTAVIQTINALDSASVPEKTEALNLGLVIAQAEKGEQSSGFPLRYLTQSLDYLYHYINPQFILDQSALDDLYIRGQIDKQRFDCLTKAHGNIPGMRRMWLDSRQPVPTPDELMRLYNRDGIDTPAFLRLMGLHGLNDPQQRQWYSDLAAYVPTPADLVPWMVRDVFDEDVVKLFNLDKDFELKFYGKGGAAKPGPAAQWAKAQGMSLDVFRFFWRAHWKISSNTELYEFTHRFREDRPEVKEWDRKHPQWTPGQPIPEDGPRPVVFTVDDLRRTLEINDLAPGLVDATVAAAFHPINRTDGINAFMAFAISDEELINIFMDNGYNRTTAEFMLKIQTRVRERRNRNATGQWTEREIIKAYREGALTGANADLHLRPLVPDNAQRARMIADADAQVQVARARATLKRLRRGYIVAAYTDDQVKKELNGLGIALNRQTDLIEMWADERMGRLREPAVKMVLDWYRKGILSQDQVYYRLEALGFFEPDLSNMVQRVKIDQQADHQKLIDREEKKREQLIKSREAAARETEKQALARQREIDKYLLALQKEKDKIAAKLAAQEAKIVKGKAGKSGAAGDNPTGANPTENVGGSPV